MNKERTQQTKHLCQILLDQSNDVYKTVLDFGDYIKEHDPELDQKKLKKAKTNFKKSINLINTILARNPDDDDLEFKDHDDMGDRKYKRRKKKEKEQKKKGGSQDG